MFFVFVILAAGLAYAAVEAKDRPTRIFLGICCAINIVGAVKTIATHDPYAFRLRPNDGYVEPAYRRP